MVKIDKKIPIPRAARNSGGAIGIWPWRNMEPGDSFFAAGYVQTKLQRKNGEHIMSVAGAKIMVPNSKWATRTVTENGVRGVRVWRVS